MRHIAETAADRNASFGVTGVLVHWDGSFFQVLEGARSTLKKIYENHILRDGRHFGLVVVIDTPISERSFSDWRMAAYGLQDEENVIAFRALIDDVSSKINATSLSGSRTLKLVHSFITTNCDRVL